jgi:hypothetical protein
LRCYSLAAAGKTKFVSSRRFDADVSRHDAEDRSDTLDHRRAIGADLRPLADDRHVDSGDGTASLAHEFCSVTQKLIGGCTPPAGITGWEMHPDIACADGAEHRIGQRVETDISVGVTYEACLVRDVDSADANAVPNTESVNVKALTDANIALPCDEQPLGSG